MVFLIGDMLYIILLNMDGHNTVKVRNCWGNTRKSKSRDLLFSIQSEGLVWNHPQGVWNPSQSDGMASRVSVYPPSD